MGTREEVAEYWLSSTANDSWDSVSHEAKPSQGGNLERQDSQTHPVSLSLVRIGLCPEFLDAQKQADTISNFFDAHLFENLLVNLQKRLAIYVILSKYPFVVAAFYAPEIVAHPVLIPVLDRFGPVEVGKFGFGGARIVLAGRMRDCRRSS